MIVENEEEQNLSDFVFMIDKTNEEDSSPLLFNSIISNVSNDINNVETAQQVESDKLFDDPKKKLTAEKSSDFLLACISMTLAIFSAGSIGPVFKYMESLGISPCLAASWRFTLHYIS